MNIMLGNLNINQIEERLGFDFPLEIKEMMIDTNQTKASDVEKGKWHCFDLPFVLVCGDVEMATKIMNSLEGKECKETLQFAHN